MISFRNDYSEGCIPEILDHFVKTNYENTIGYGEDDYCARAKDLIRKKIKCLRSDIYFLVGGTQTNMIMIAQALRPHQGVISVNTGHIAVHETGSIEATGHKVLEMENPVGDGKLTVEMIKKAQANVLPPHMVQPKMVYVSNPTEIGTLYTKKELKAIYDHCKKNDLYLYLDGARLAMGLASDANDISLEDYPKLTDAFYIGGTKCGAMFGEALVIINGELKKDIDYVIKQRGGLMAKGRLLGLQFEILFSKDNYIKYGKHADDMAMMLKKAFVENGIKLDSDSYTNQQFPIFSNDIIQKLEKKYIFEPWRVIDKKTSSVRFVTSWATKATDIKNFVKDLKNILKK